MKIFKKIAVMIFILLITACHNDNRHLSNLELDLLEEIKISEYGAAGPRLLHYNNSKNYITILDTSGLVVYDIASNKIKAIIDTKSLDFNNLQGSNITTAIGNDNELILLNLEENNRYLKINLENKNNEIIDKIDLDNYKSINIYEIKEDELEVINKEILNEYQAIQTDEEIVVFTNNYESENKKWKVIILSKNDLKIKKVINIF